MKFEFSPGMASRLRAMVEKAEFEVGVLDDKPHLEPVETPSFFSGQEPTLGSYAGGPVRKTTMTIGPMIGSILVDNMERLGINLLWRPFEEQNSDIMKFTRSFLDYVMRGRVSEKRLENLLQAIVRNPILRQEYGGNNPATADAKGFDRHLIDTGQMFKAIRARVIRVNRK